MSTPLHSSFGATLRHHRLRAGISLREFAAGIVYSPGHVSHIETGVKPPTIKFAQACERELGLPGQLVPLVRADVGVPLAQLPAAGGTFIGRDSYIQRILSSLQDPHQILLEGPPGIGKTTLAMRCASDHGLARHYPDGALFADLHGFTPSQSPVRPSDVADDFLRALGVSQEQISVSETARFALLRSVLSQRRILIVLDNAASVSQVRPLLPGTTRCSVIVTSRRQLSGLAVRDGATRIGLGPLREDEAIMLLTQTIGGRAEAEPEHTAALAKLCSYWPLALRVISERAVAYEYLGLAELCRELREAQLDILSADEEEDDMMSVRAVFDLSYHALEADEAATFRLLGLHPGSDISLAAVAALSGQRETETRTRMQRLRRGNLVTEYPRERYRLHDLLRAYAAERLARENISADREAATTRLLDYYLGTIATTTAILAPYRMHPNVDLSALSTPVTHHRTYEEALAWCDAEVPNFPEIMRLAVTHQYPKAWRFAASLWDYFHIRQPWGCWWTTTTEAQQSLKYDPDPYGQAWLLTSLGDHLRRRGDSAGARPLFEQALAIRQEIDDRPGQGWLWWCLGLTHSAEGRTSEAVHAFKQGLEIFIALDDVYAQGRCLQLTGHVLWESGDREGAVTHLHEAFAYFERVDDAHDQALVWSALGSIEGDAERSIDYLDCALPILRDVGDWQGEVDALVASGEAYWRLGQAPLAHQHWREALKILHDQEEAEQAAALAARIDTTTEDGEQPTQQEGCP